MAANSLGLPSEPLNDAVTVQDPVAVVTPLYISIAEVSAPEPAVEPETFDQVMPHPLSPVVDTPLRGLEKKSIRLFKLAGEMLSVDMLLPLDFQLFT